MVHEIFVINIVQMRSGRTFHVSQSAWAQDTENFRESFVVPVNVLQDIQRGDDVNASVGQGAATQVELEQWQIGHAFSQLHKRCGQVIRTDESRLGQGFSDLLQHVARGTTNIQDDRSFGRRELAQGVNGCLPGSLVYWMITSSFFLV